MEKIKIKPYLWELIRENAIYLGLCAFMLILMLVISRITFSKTTDLDGKIAINQKSVNELQTRYNLLTTEVPQTADLDSDIKLLNKLIPNVEDYFSLIYALDSLSQQTGFVISSYTVNVKKSTDEKLKLTVSGSGDTTSFINFLDSYNFSGGRLITSDKIELNPQSSGDIRVDLTFYNKKVSLDYNQNMKIDPQVFDSIASIRGKVNFSFEEATDSGSVNLDYPTKANIF